MREINQPMDGKEIAKDNSRPRGSDKMDRIILFMENKENCRLLKELLSGRYKLTVADLSQTLNDPFDLAILDGPALKKLWKALWERKKAEEPAFLPFLFITPRQNVRLATQDLWQVVDDLVLTPVEKIELQARLEVLLRARRLSVGLEMRNEDLEAMTQAMTHDLRAHLRVILGFTHAMSEDQADKMNEQGLHYMERIQNEVAAAQNMVDTMYSFLQLGRESVRKQPVNLEYITNICLSNLAADIENQKAKVEVEGELPEVQGDPTLLRVAIQNLLSNAIRYVAPEVCPRVTFSVDVMDTVHRIQVRDNGIGIPPEDRERIFQPFVRLHGIEEYPGMGLGLSAVRKAMELMGGRIGMESEPGIGSMFWIELPRNQQ